MVETDKKFIIISNLNTVANKEILSFSGIMLCGLGLLVLIGGAKYFDAPKELYDPIKMSNEKNGYLKECSDWRVKWCGDDTKYWAWS